MIRLDIECTVLHEEPAMPNTDRLICCGEEIQVAYKDLFQSSLGKV
jgi:hypothetical protein